MIFFELVLVILGVLVVGRLIRDAVIVRTANEETEDEGSSIELRAMGGNKVVVEDTMLYIHQVKTLFCEESNKIIPFENINAVEVSKPSWYSKGRIMFTYIEDKESDEPEKKWAALFSGNSPYKKATAIKENIENT
jgi:hypothetical protein